MSGSSIHNPCIELGSGVGLVFAVLWKISPSVCPQQIAHGLPHKFENNFQPCFRTCAEDIAGNPTTRSRWERIGRDEWKIRFDEMSGLFLIYPLASKSSFVTIDVGDAQRGVTRNTVIVAPRLHGDGEID